MIFTIETLQIDLIENQYGLHMTAFTDEFPLPGQTLEETKSVITNNFKIVKEKYIKAASNGVSLDDINEVSLKIVIHYFYLYNTWKSLYEKEKDRDLTFRQEDYTHPNTYDKIIQFFRNKYPKDYVEKCAIILEIPPEILSKYEYDRHEFYSSFR